MDYTKAIEVAKNVFWVGVTDEKSFFRSNSYLIKGENEAVLIDPGSLVQYEQIRDKVLSIVPKEQLKYVVCQHQDPDVSSALYFFVKEGFKFKTIAHSRVSALLVFYSKDLDLYNIDYHDFSLEWDNGKKLEFIFTPYFHSPGAFATYEPEKKLLFSSDIFGAFQKDWNLYADEHYFDAMKAFNELYVPSSEIANFTIKKFEQKEIDMILPQHGSIIKKELVKSAMDTLKEMKAGIFLENATAKIADMETTSEIPQEMLNEMLDIVAKRAAEVLGKEEAEKIKQEVLNGKPATSDSIKEFMMKLREKNRIASAVVKMPLINYAMDNADKLKGKIPSLVKEIIYL